MDVSWPCKINYDRLSLAYRNAGAALLDRIGCTTAPTGIPTVKLVAVASRNQNFVGAVGHTGACIKRYPLGTLGIIFAIFFFMSIVHDTNLLHRKLKVLRASLEGGFFRGHGH